MKLFLKRLCNQLRIRDKGKNNVIKLPQIFNNRNALISIEGNNNTIEIGDNFTCGKKCSFRLIGDNLDIKIGKDFKCRNKFDLSFYANDSKVLIEDNVRIDDGLSIDSFGRHKNLSIRIGKNSSFMETSITCFEDDSSINIGEDCMFSYRTVVYNTDGHPIFEKDGNEVINRAHEINIGNHVWVGHSAVILKNVTIGDENIIGRGSIVTKSFTCKNCAIAGVPAKVCKQDVRWDALYPPKFWK